MQGVKTCQFMSENCFDFFPVSNFMFKNGFDFFWGFKTVFTPWFYGPNYFVHLISISKTGINWWCHLSSKLKLEKHLYNAFYQVTK